MRVTTDDGVEGFGEVCPLGPAYLPPHAEGARAALRELAPAVLGARASSNLGGRQRGAGRALCSGHGYAKSAIDIACWDALGQAVGRPVCQLLGGLLSERFPLYFAVPLGPADEMAEYVAARRGGGHPPLPAQARRRPAARTPRARARVVEATGDDDIVVADANGGWGFRTRSSRRARSRRSPRVFLEQPCPTLEECLDVRERTTLPMVLDESIHDVQSLLRAYEARAMEAFNLKVSKVGGLTRARLMRDLAAELGLRLTIEDTWGGDLVTAAVAHLAASTRPDALFTVSFMNDWTNEHVAGHEPRSSSGFGAAPTAPGLGVDVDAAALGEPLFEIRG